MKKIIFLFGALCCFICSGFSHPANYNLKEDTMPVLVSSSVILPTASVTLRERLSVSTGRIYPEWVAGDRDFAGHGPNVNLRVTLTLSVDGAQLEGLIVMTAKEVGGDGTEASITQKRTLAYAPKGRKFNRIITAASSGGRYTDNNFDLDYITPFSATGPVKRFVVKGDTDGKDVGNSTDDDCYLNVEFNNIEVETGPLTNGVKEIEIPFNTIANQLRTSFSGTRGRINNFGPCANGTCLVQNASFIKFPNAIMRDTIKFPIDEIYTNARHYYFNDINLRNISCQFNENYLNANINFESDGPELVGKCANDLGSFDAGCIAGTPSAQVNNLVVTLGLKLIVRSGKLTYEAMDIQPAVGSNFSVDCGILDWLCGEIFKDAYQSGIFGLAGQVRHTMDNNAFVTQVGESLTPQMINAINLILAFRRLPAGATALVDVSKNNENLLIRYR